MTNKTDEEIATEFFRVVNMKARELRHWLESEESREVGYTHEGEAESVGHHSGRRIVEILEKRKNDYDEDDRKHMRKVVGYVHRHMAQKPHGDTSQTRWAYSLKNWGHDPAKDSRTSISSAKSA